MHERWENPWWRRLTWRAMAVVAAAIFVVAYPIYVYVDSTVTGGISHRGDLLVVNLQAMSNFEMDQDNGTTDDIPLRYRQLDGKRVLLTGQMYDPYTAAGRVHNFVLCYSISNCCFMGPPKAQHLVQATVLPGRNVEDCSNGDVVDVQGILHVGVRSADGHVISVYRLDVEKVQRD